MSMVYVIIILGYLLCSALCVHYVFHTYDKKKSYDGYCVVILGIEFTPALADRIAYGKNIVQRHQLIDCCVTGMKNHSDQEHYFRSLHTYDDAVQVEAFCAGKPIILVTSGAHMRRSYRTFKRAFGKQRTIVAAPIYDLAKPWGPFSPIGWYFVLLNIIKDFRYNGY